MPLPLIEKIVAQRACLHVPPVRRLFSQARAWLKFDDTFLHLPTPRRMFAGAFATPAAQPGAQPFQKEATYCCEMLWPFWADRDVFKFLLSHGMSGLG